jgi:hypothetical protein
MTTKVINIKNKKALEILKSLESINFIEFAVENNYAELLKLKPKNIIKTNNLLELKGIWKNRNITVTQLREKAWPPRK